MRTAAILLALVVVLNAREAGADAHFETRSDYTISFGDNQIGFIDGHARGLMFNDDWSQIRLDPLVRYNVPFTATQGFIGLIVILVAMIVLPIAVLATWRKKRITQ